MSGRATNLCLSDLRKNEGRNETETEKNLILGLHSAFQSAGKMLFRREEAEKSPIHSPYKSQLTGNARRSCLGSLNMNSLGGRQGRYRAGTGWGGGGGFQQDVSKENRKPGA